MLQKTKFLALLISICALAPALCSSLESDGWVTINLQHSLTGSDQSVFTERGNITIQSLRLGSATVMQKPLSSEDQQKLRTLAADNKFYQLKSTVTTSDGTQTSFISTLKACMLAESELNDILSVSLDYTGRVITVTLAVASTSACEGALVPVSKLKEFTTSVFVRHTENGPVPDTGSYIQKLERERDAKEKGEVKDNRSFLAKYWMYIVPVVIIMVLSSAANPDGAAGGSGS